MYERVCARSISLTPLAPTNPHHQNYHHHDPHHLHLHKHRRAPTCTCAGTPRTWPGTCTPPSAPSSRSTGACGRYRMCMLCMNECGGKGVGWSGWAFLMTPSWLAWQLTSLSFPLSSRIQSRSTTHTRQGPMRGSEEEAEAFLQELKQRQRYVLDIWS